jgi:general secretion pathway protein D
MQRFSIFLRKRRTPLGVLGVVSRSVMCVAVYLCLVGAGLVVPVSSGLAAPASGRNSVSGAVEGEIIRRQKEIFAAEKLIMAGDDLVADGVFGAAVDKYAQAYNGLTPSPTSEKIRNFARSRFAVASTKHAEQLIKAAEFGEAELVIDRVLDPAVAPDFSPARKIKQRLADPEWYNKARTPLHQKQVEEVQRLLILGAGAVELADYDKAEAYYASALRIDKYNTAARRGMAEAERAVIGYLQAARDQTRIKMMRQVEEVWETEVEVSDAFGDGPQGGGPQGGVLDTETVEMKLYSTMLERVEFDDATLEEVIEYLTIKSQEADITGKGLNFVLNLDPSDETARNAKVNLRLRNIPMGEVLKYVTRDTGTSFRSDAYAVKIVSRVFASTELVMKRFRVPPDFLDTAAVPDDGAGAIDPFNPTPEAGGRGLLMRRLGAKDILMKQGVTFPEGSSAFLKSGGTTLVVRNTAANLDLIEAIIDATYADVPQQLEVHVTMIDIATNDLHELGFDWLLGAFNGAGSDRVFAAGGTYGGTSSTGAANERTSEFPFVAPGAADPVGTFPLTAGLRSGRQWNEGDSINNILLQGQNAVLANPSSLKAPGLFALAGPFTDPQFQVVLRGLSQSKSSDVVTRPSIVTRSGQRAVIDIIREFPYPTEYDPPEIPQNFGGGGGGGGGLGGLGQASANSFPVTPAHPTAFEVRSVGTHLEVEPIIGPDNYTVELNLTPELVQFEGFVNYGSPITTTGTNALGVLETIPLTENRILQPVFRTTRENTSVVVWDGATVAIGALYEERSQDMSDQVPILSDVPLVGRFFRSKGQDRVQRAIMIFVKVNVIDPSGQRVNRRS